MKASSRVWAAGLGKAYPGAHKPGNFPLANVQTIPHLTRVKTFLSPTHKTEISPLTPIVAGERIFEVMKANGVKPSIATYTALLGAYYADNDVRKAWEVYQSILKVCIGEGAAERAQEQPSACRYLALKCKSNPAFQRPLRSWEVACKSRPLLGMCFASMRLEMMP